MAEENDSDLDVILILYDEEPKSKRIDSCKLGTFNEKTVDSGDWKEKSKSFDCHLGESGETQKSLARLVMEPKAVHILKEEDEVVMFKK